MSHTRTISLDPETLTWGLLFLWWGIRNMLEFLPEGAGAIGTGLILLGLNGFRLLKRTPINWLSTTVGILFLLVGGLMLTHSVLHLPVEIPIFALALLAIGVVILVREIFQRKNA